MKSWGRVTWDDLVMFRGEQLMHSERESLFKLRERKKGRGR